MLWKFPRWWVTKSFGINIILLQRDTKCCSSNDKTASQCEPAPTKLMEVSRHDRRYRVKASDQTWFWYLYQNRSRPGTMKATYYSREGRTNIAETNVGESDLRVGILVLDGSRDARLLVTCTTGNTGFGGIGTDGIVRIEPQHICKVVVPKGHNKDHTLRQKPCSC